MVAAQKVESALSPGPVLIELAISHVMVPIGGLSMGFAAMGLPKKRLGLVGFHQPFLRVV